jgi:alkylation response protein AidB-like acyl-CoA dehydrogenase
MDFNYSEEQLKLQKEVREFFIKELPSDYRARGARGQSMDTFNFWLELQKKAGEKGYLAPGWSKDSGGLGLSDMEQGVVMEETSYWGATWPSSQGLRVCGPPLHVFGTEEQKKKFLPPIAKGEVIWYQGFTEPDAGSDEANVSLRAIEDGDDYVLNGQKTFITAPGPADFLYTLARTQEVTPKHRGISLFLIDAHSPGISYRALPTLGIFTVEIFFDNVRVPKSRLLGELNRGFYHAMVTFEFERSTTGGGAGARRGLEELLEFARSEKRHGQPLIKDESIRELMADRAIEMQLTWLQGWFAAWHFSQRDKLGSPPPEAGGLHNKMMTNQRAEQLMNSMGLYGQLRRTSKYAKYDGAAAGSWEGSRSTHPAGTIEVNKIVLAGRGLGLPRVPAKFNKEIREAVDGRS